MNLIQIVSINFAIVMTAMSLLWLVSLVVKDASIVDMFWGFGFVLIAWCMPFLVPDMGWRSWLLFAMVTIWGIRLTIYLCWRNLGKAEDRRYAEMRNKHGTRFWRVSLYTVFGLQGLVMWFLAGTYQVGMFYNADASPNLLDLCGVLIWLIGVSFETIGDWQLALFKSSPENKGKVMDRGLWRFTRHPNYFGDFCVWWGIYLVAVSAGAWWTIPGPLLISFLLLKVSGVTMLESDIEERRPEYAEYKKRTNAFFPGPPS